MCQDFIVDGKRSVIGYGVSVFGVEIFIFGHSVPYACRDDDGTSGSLCFQTPHFGHRPVEIVGISAVRLGECRDFALVKWSPESWGQTFGKHFPVCRDAAKLSGARVEEIFVPAGRDCYGLSLVQCQFYRSVCPHRYCGRNQFYGAPCDFPSLRIEECQMGVVTSARVCTGRDGRNGEPEQVGAVGRTVNSVLSAAETLSFFENLPIYADLGKVREIVVVLYGDGHFLFARSERCSLHEGIYGGVYGFRLPIVSRWVAP